MPKQSPLASASAKPNNSILKCCLFYYIKSHIMNLPNRSKRPGKKNQHNGVKVSHFSSSAANGEVEQESRAKSTLLSARQTRVVPLNSKMPRETSA